MKSDRYYVRWRTNLVDGCLVFTGWDVCDHDKFDKIALASFDDDEEDKADALCKLMNSIEEETNGVSK